MAGKFMRIKKFILPVMAAVILTSQLAGCAAVTSTEMLDMLNEGQDIEISIAVPDYEISSLGDFQALRDVQLDQLQTFMAGGFREGFDTLFGIQPIELTNFSSKSGCVFVNGRGEQDGNTSFMDSLRNKVFMEKYFASPNVQTKLGELGEQAYTDIDSDSAYAQMAALNAYYNLLNDGINSDDTYYNATQSVTRGDFYSFVYRATNGVNNLLKTQGDFKNQVGVQSDNALYASQVDQYAWLNADNGGLRKGNYNQSISRAEAIYMLMNLYFEDELNSINVSEISLSDAKDGGEMLDDSIPDKKESDQLYSVDKKTKEQTLANGWQLGVISKMMKSADGNVHTDIYKALGLAESLGIIESETRYNEPVSKSEAIELLINVGEALNKRDGYLSNVEYGDASMYIFESDEEIAGIEGESNLDENGEVITEVEGKTPGGKVDTSDSQSQGQSQTPTTPTPPAQNNGGGQTSKPSTPPAQNSGGQTSTPTPPVNDSPYGELGDSDITGDLDNWGSDNTDGGDASNLQQGFDPVQ